MMKINQKDFVVEFPGQRLDQYLAERLPRLSRGHVKRMVEQGAVQVNGAPGQADRRLKAGDAVCVDMEPALWDASFGRVADWVLHEDRELLVLEKPAGLLMHPLGESWLEAPEAALAEPEPNLAGMLLRDLPGIVQAGTPRCGIVHRLDRLTSGVLLVAKTPRSYEALIEAFKAREVTKTYRALVRGAWAQRRSRVEAPVGRKPGHRKVLATPFGKAAETAFTVLESCPRAALVEAQPLTGRTHQIRVHLDLLGHPVMGDLEFDKQRPGEPWPPRMMLHAYRVAFVHPATGRPVQFLARIPADMRDFWKLCQNPVRRS
ncbi:MAG: RluA family pseudouridine synthase [Elusimicrobiota bacterium]|jgi:23S rRNA pseudouridine1911/1915/1917 synthase